MDRGADRLAVAPMVEQRIMLRLLGSAAAGAGVNIAPEHAPEVNVDRIVITGQVSGGGVIVGGVPLAGDIDVEGGGIVCCADAVVVGQSFELSHLKFGHGGIGDAIPRSEERRE